MLQARTDTARGQDPSDGSDELYALSKAICLQNIMSRADRSHPMEVTYYVGGKSVDRSNPLAKYISRANTREYLRTEEICRFTCPSNASKHSDSKAGRRIDAYLLVMASGRIFSSRVLEIASGLLSLRVKAKDFMHAYFRKMNWEVLMQLSLQQTL